MGRQLSNEPPARHGARTFRRHSESRRRFHPGPLCHRLPVRLLFSTVILEGFSRVVGLIDKLMKRAVRFVAQKDEKNFPGLVVA